MKRPNRVTRQFAKRESQMVEIRGIELEKKIRNLSEEDKVKVIRTVLGTTDGSKRNKTNKRQIRRLEID